MGVQENEFTCVIKPHVT